MSLRVFIAFWLLHSGIIVSAQSIANSNKCFTKPDVIDGREVLSTVTQQPAYTGGLSQFYKDVMNTLKYPKGKEKAPEKVTMTFVIDTTGHVRNFCFIKPEDGRYDSQIDTLIKKIDHWTPGKLYKRNVNVRMLLPMIIEWK